MKISFNYLFNIVSR